MFSGEFFNNPMLPLAAALITGGMRQQGPSPLGRYIMMALPMSMEMAQQQKREKAAEEFYKSGGAFLQEPFGLTEEQANAVSKAMAYGVPGVTQMLSLRAAGERPALQTELTKLQILKLLNEMGQQEQAQRAFEAIVRGQSPQAAGSQMAFGAQGGQAEGPVDPKIYLMASGMPGMSEGQRAALRSLYDAGRKEENAPLLNEFNQRAFALLGRMPRTPDEFRAVLNDARIEKREDRAATAAAAAAAAAAATANINRNQPMPTSELLHYVDKYGNSPPPGTTVSQVQSGQYRLVSANERNSIKSAQSAYAVLNKIESLSKQVMSNSSLASRMAAAPANAYQMLAQERPEVAELHGLINGTLAPIVRQLGETGALATEDIRRAQAAMPRIFPVPDTPEVAVKKVNTLREIIKKGSGVEPMQAQQWSPQMEAEYQAYKRTRQQQEMLR